MKPSNVFLFLLSVILSAVLLGCSLIPSTEEQLPPSQIKKTPENEPVERSLVEVENIEIQVLGPTQVNVISRGYLPNNCATIADTTQFQTGQMFFIAIFSLQTADEMCIQQMTPFEETTPLEVNGLQAGEYMVDVNGLQTQFNLVGIPATSAPTAKITGLVWHDLCAVGGGQNGAPFVPTAGCTSLGNNQYRANGFLDNNEQGLGNIQVNLGAGACPATGLGSVTSDSSGIYSFTGLVAGNYCVSIEPLSQHNTPLLVPGDWSYPAESIRQAIASQTIILGEGENKQQVNFGWDYQLLPVPPQIVPTATPPPTAVPLPCDWAQFVADVSISDYTPFTPGSGFTKIWRIKNIGSCTWTTDYDLVFISGNAMTGETTVALPQNVLPGHTIDLSVKMTAPNSSGNYKGLWMLRNPAGTTFGLGNGRDTAFWVLIKVVAPNTDYGYDFAANYCSASWNSAAGNLSCPGNTSSSKGSVTYLDNPVLENRTENEPTLWVRPNHDEGGWISGSYPAIRVRNGDRFKAWVGCLGDNQGCDMTFTLSYRFSGGSLNTLGQWHEVYDELARPIDLDLSALVGQYVEFVLTAKINNKKYDSANGFWFVPRIVSEPPDNSNQAVENARTYVAVGLGVNRNELDLISVEGPVEWLDTCLGVHLPEQICAEAVIPGYRIIFSLNDRRYEAHTNMDGSVVYWFELG